MMNDTGSSWFHTSIFSQHATSLDTAPVWLIVIVSMLILVLKAVKLSLKWKSKKLNTNEVVQSLTEVLLGMKDVLSTKQTASLAPDKLYKDIVDEIA